MAHIGRTATTVYSNAVQYHQTVVFALGEKSFSVAHGGWVTPTTRKRINQALDHFGIDARAYIRDGSMFLDYDNKTYTVTAGGEYIPLAEG